MDLRILAVIAGFGLILLLFFPIVVETNVYYNSLQNKIFFSLAPYKLFPIYGGYATLTNTGIILHYGKKKAKFKPFISGKKEKPKPKFNRVIRILEWKTTEALYGLPNEYLLALFGWIHAFTNALYPSVEKQKLFLHIRNGILIYPSQEKTVCSISLQTTVLFNLAGFLYAIVQNVLQNATVRSK